MTTDPIGILRDLVGIPSPSAVSNGPMIEYADAFLRGRGWSVRRFPYLDSQGVEKENLIAVNKVQRTSRLHAELALCAHTDTVPWDPGWTEATTLVERNDRLYGRGTCDMKGFIAATFAAIAELDPKVIRRPLAIVLTADEEVGCVGAKHLAAAGLLKPRFAIVGEPTSLRPVRTGKGYGLAEARVRGREAHSAFPQEGASAILASARMIQGLETIGRSLQRRKNHLFDPPYTTLNVGTIEGGRAKNIVPGECRFLIEWRPIPDIDRERVTRRLARDTARIGLHYPGVEATLEVVRSDFGFATPAQSNVLRALERISGKPSGGIAFGTEAPQYQKLGAEVVVFGPGDMREAHRTGEFLAKSELITAAQMLQQAVAFLCGQ